MAELADAHGSGPCESNFMEVQVLLSAPYRVFIQNLKGFDDTRFFIALNQYADSFYSSPSILIIFLLFLFAVLSNFLQKQSKVCCLCFSKEVSISSPPFAAAKAGNLFPFRHYYGENFISAKCTSDFLKYFLQNQKISDRT